MAGPSNTWTHENQSLESILELLKANDGDSVYICLYALFVATFLFSYINLSPFCAYVFLGPTPEIVWGGRRWLTYDAIYNTVSPAATTSSDRAVLTDCLCLAVALADLAANSQEHTG